MKEYMLNFNNGQEMEINLKDVTGIAVDSREAKPGFIFVAINVDPPLSG